MQLTAHKGDLAVAAVHNRRTTSNTPYKHQHSHLPTDDTVSYATLHSPANENRSIVSTCVLAVCPSTNTGCPRRNGQNFGRVFLMLKKTDRTQNTYIQS